MAWFRIDLTEEEQQIVKAERDSHPQEHVRRKMRSGAGQSESGTA
jgi:hypothetical protein